MSSEQPLLGEASSSSTAETARYEEIQRFHADTISLIDICDALVNAAQFHMIVRYKAILLMPVAALLAGLFFYLTAGSSTALTVIAIVLIPVAPLSIGIVWTIREDFQFRKTIFNINRWSAMHRVQEPLRSWNEIQEKFNRAPNIDQVNFLLDRQENIIRKYYICNFIKLVYMVNCIDPSFITSNSAPGFRCCCTETEHLREYTVASDALPRFLISMPSCQKIPARAGIIREAVSKFLAVSDDGNFGFCISELGDVENFYLMISGIIEVGFVAGEEKSEVFSFIDTIPNSKLQKAQFDKEFQAKINASLHIDDV